VRFVSSRRAARFAEQDCPIVPAVDGTPATRAGDASSPRIEIVRGPLAPQQLGAIARLYGARDPKYRDTDFVHRVFDGSGHGASVHAFAHDAGETIGHVGAIRLPTLVGGTPVVSGKFEALVVDDSARSLSVRGEPVALALLRALTEALGADGVQLLHGTTTPQIGVLMRLAGFRRVPVDAPAYFGVTTPELLESAGTTPRLLLSAAAAGGRALASAVRVWGRAVHRSRVVVRPADAGDLSLVRTRLEGWTVDVSSCWEWLCSIGRLETVVIEGRRPCRAVVRPPATPGDDLHVLAWDSELSRTGAAILLAEMRRRAAHARAVRVQPWQLDRAARVAGAARMLGFVRRPYSAGLYVRARDLDPGPVSFTPFFYAPF
jgi:hypothetical protein